MLNKKSQDKVRQYVSFLRHHLLADGATFEYVYSMGDKSILESFRKCCGCDESLFTEGEELRAILEFDTPERTFDILYEDITHSDDEPEVIDTDIDVEDGLELASLHEALEDDEEDDSEVICAKGIMDGAETLDEAIMMIKEFAIQLSHMKSEGYKLVTDIEDDYGYILKEDCEQKD
jgi:hypothetical protein